MLWSSASSLALCLLLFNLYLIVDLLAHRGRVDLLPDEAAQLAELAGPERAPEADSDELTVAFPAFEENGILPTIWWGRDTYWGQVLAAAYRRIGFLRSNSSALIMLVLTALLISFARSAAISRARRLSMETGLDAAMRLRKTLHRQALRLGPSDLKGDSSERVLTLFTEEMDRVRDGVAIWSDRLGRHPFQLFMLLVLAMSINPLTAIQCLIPLAACWFLVQKQQHRYEASRYRDEVRMNAELRLLAESFHKTRLVRGFGMDNFEQEQFRKHLERFRDNVLAFKRRENRTGSASRSLVIVFIAIVLYLVGSKVLQAPDDLSLAAALLLLGTLLSMHWPLTAMSQLQVDRENASLAAERVFRYLNQVPEVSQAVGAKFLEPLSRMLHFESVTYVLPNKRKLISGLDLQLEAGSVVALISLNPMAARAIAYMLPRFIEPVSGRILIDGEDIAWATLESLRAETIYVGGHDPFFTGTVLENISCGNPDYSLQSITDAAKTTHVHNFIPKLSQGYETLLGEHGEQLDVGQSFRLGLARAMLRDPGLMIIEEPTETLNDDTKSLLDDSYNRITAKRTVLFLPSRLSTLRRADKIVLIHDGKVNAISDYATLVKKSSLYRHWEYVNFNQFRDMIDKTAES
jgi:ABC-type multidrug transport system fused ATPase/permease subunit